MRTVMKELWEVFLGACEETPTGMFAPFRAFWRVATHNPVLSRSRK